MRRQHDPASPVRESSADGTDAASGRRLRVVFHNLLLEQELFHVAEVFERSAIPWIALKGVTMARELFGTLEEYPRGDNDVLVQRQDAWTAFVALKQLGYRSMAPRRLADDLVTNYQHPLVRMLPNGKWVMLELHWHAFSPIEFPVPLAALWSGRRTYSHGSREIPVMAPEHIIVHLAVHFALHHFRELRIAREVGRAWDIWPEHHDAALAFARRTHLSATVEYGLAIAKEAGYLELPTPALAAHGARLLARLLPPRTVANSPPPRGYAQEALRICLMRPRRVPYYVMRRTLPTWSELAANKPDAGPVGRAGEYVLRPLRALQEELARLRTRLP